MIERISLTNFRKFERFSVSLHKGNILVGPNNCGKSSILDAFRLLESCYRHTRTRGPTLLSIPGEGIFDGYEIAERLLPFKLANATHNYSDADAIVEFWLEDGTRAVIRLHPERQTRFYIDKNQARLMTSSKFRSAFPIDLIIVPTLAPLEVEEPIVERETVQRNERTRLASRVLRNIWLSRSDEEFESLRDDVESAWPKIKIHKPHRVLAQPPFVEMFYSENRIDREVQWAGFGFQVWLQIQTHLRRGGPTSTLIIDEPDIYLHPDLQRRLLRDTKGRFAQYVMATHAIEIINEAEASEIITVNSEASSGKRVKTDEDYASVYQYLGSANNVDLAKIARAQRVVFVEGEDGRLLRKLGAKLNLESLSNPQNVPIVQLGGVSEWRRATHAVWAFRKILDINIAAYCLFDRDYRSDEEIDDFLSSAGERNFKCSILERKEIENFLLDPECVRRAAWARIRSRAPNTSEPTLQDAEAWLHEASEPLKYLVMSRRIASILRFAKEKGMKTNQTTLIEQATQQFDKDWLLLNRRISLAPGKELFARLNDILQSKYKISLTETKLIDNLSIDLVDSSFLKILGSLDEFCAAR